MGLQIIMGKSGSGKTAHMLREMIDNSKGLPDVTGRLLYIVPEQFTMETQKNIVKYSNGAGSMAIDVLSFDRLAKRVFEEQGYNPLTILDDTGKCLILRKIIEDNKNRLGIFAKKAGYPGFIDEMKSVISEFYQYGIKAKNLQDIINDEKISKLLKEKLKDIHVILTEFDAFIKDKYVVNEELLHKLITLIPDSEFIKNSQVYLDEYTGFTPIQYDVLRQLLKYSKNVTFAATIRDADKVDFAHVDTRTNIFGLGIKAVNMLKTIAMEEGVEVSSDIIMQENHRFKKDELIHLEKSLFKYKYDALEVIDKNSINIYSCQDTEDEVRFLARNIRELIFSGYRYKDIAVITGDIHGYSPIISEIFSKNDISFFIDDKKSMTENPIVETIRALLNMVMENFSQETVFAYLRRSLTNITMEEADELENYVISKGIRGKSKYFKEFVQRPEAIKRGMETDPKELQHLNEIREKFIKEIADMADFFKKPKKNSVSESFDVINIYLENIGAKDKLEDMKEHFQAMGDLSKVREYMQAFTKVNELTEKMKNLIGMEKLKVDEFLALLESAFEDIKVGVVPASLDRVVVGDIQRTRLNDIKVLFLIGANEGIIPAAEGDGKVLSETERRYMQGKGIEMAPDSRENGFIQKYYLYLILTKMSDKLVVTYKKTDGTNSASPSYIIRTLINLFKDLKVKESEKCSKMLAYNIDMALEYVAENISDFRNDYMLQKEQERFIDIYNVLKKNDVDMTDLIEASEYAYKETELGADIASVIYGRELHNSVSRLERYVNCAYSQFLNYGLNLYPRREFELNQMDIGNIYHAVMQEFVNQVIDKKIDLVKLSDSERENIITNIVNIQGENIARDIFEDSSRNKYMKKVINRIANKTAWAIQEQIKSGKFMPEYTECKFDSKKDVKELSFSYDNGSEMTLKGIIDRVDYYQDGDDVYVRIIDYKTGGKKLELNDAYNGLQIQLIIYMKAAMAMAKKKYPDKNIIPAGIFYLGVGDEDIKKEDLKSDVFDENGEFSKEYKDLKLQNYTLNGLINQSAKVLMAMDEVFTQPSQAKSKVINVKMKKDGSPDANALSRLKSTEQLNDLVECIKNKAKSIGKDMTDGKIAINPNKVSDSLSACTYCDYKEVCRFDRRIKNFDYKRFKTLEESELWEKIKEGGKSDAELD